MACPSRFWSDLCWQDFAALDPERTVAVLPLAAVEQHGPHLPLSVDAVLADAMIARTLPLLPAELAVLVLPTQQVGYSVEHVRFPGTLTLSPVTTMALWTELGESVARAGLGKLLLFNTHGGNVALMDVVARELRTRCGLIVYGCSWWNLPLGDAIDQGVTQQEQRFGIHAGEIETSLMLALARERVRMERAGEFRSSAQDRAAQYAILGNGVSAKLGWQMQDYNAQGAAGNAAGATAEKGERLLDAAARALANLLGEIAALPLSTLVERPAT